MTREQAKNAIEGLAKDFLERYEEFHTPEYKEFNLRQSFIVPFFNALGWDVENKDQISEAYREVISEDSLKIQGKTKAPDYGFRLQGSDKRRLFFVEAKKPNVSLKTNKEPSYQLRRYGRSAQVPISILTNFEEFVVYDCTKRPNQNDSASVARIKYINFKDYAKEFEFIYDTFSHEAVLKGRFSKFVQSDTHRKGTQTLDKDFVESLDKWRKYLAVSIALNNQKLNEEEINFVVQQTIDRLIFLRFCEDRGVETYGQLQAAASKGEGYKNLFDLFKQADDKYNSGLFDFEKDTLSAKLKVDNKVVKNIITELYYPDCEYDFRVMPVEVLGNAYEQFLGKVIRITASHSARIEEKPEVRKAGGVYYTPQYIVEYIVQNTIGKLITGKSPKEIERLKIVDPACGSGSFLIGAFEYLMSYHVKWYHDNGYLNKKVKDNPLHPNGALTTHEKKKILLNNIFGVDLDSNAVEVSKLSLLLKCMEGETEASIKQQLSVFHERVLPDLDSNIKSGNSLIETDFYDEEMDLGFYNKVKPFNWKKGFPDVFKQNGFDVVIGNPPYVRQELLDNLQKEYFERKYEVYHGIADLYSYFFEKGISILNDKGLFGIIVANKWMRTNFGEPLRKWLKNQNITEIIDFGDLPVFQGITTYPCIFISTKGKVSKQFDFTNVKTLQFRSIGEYVAQHKIVLEQKSLEDSSWNLASDKEQKLLKKINDVGIPFSKYVKEKNFRGVLTGLNEAFVIDSETQKRLIKEDKNCVSVIKPFLAGRDVKHYQLPESSKFLIFFPKGWTNSKGKQPKNPWKFLQETYPSIAKHLAQFESAGKKRQDKGDYWWELRACDYYAEFTSPKIIYPNILKRPEFTFDEKGWFTNQKCFIIPCNDKYLLGFLNSRLNHFLFEKYLPKLRGGFYEPSYVFFKNFPIKQIDSKNKSETSKRDQIIKHADLLLKLHEELPEISIHEKREHAKQQIEHSEEKINQLIYELYELNENDIKLIEDTIKS
jgi:type I restriction-modification system DNA methylase subunit